MSVSWRHCLSHHTTLNIIHVELNTTHNAYHRMCISPYCILWVLLKNIHHIDIVIVNGRQIVCCQCTLPLFICDTLYLVIVYRTHIASYYSVIQDPHFVLQFLTTGATLYLFTAYRKPIVLCHSLLLEIHIVSCHCLHETHSILSGIAYSRTKHVYGNYNVRLHIHNGA